jgi:hypothetical protein
VIASALRNLQCTSSGRDAAFIRDGMSGIEPRGFRGQRGWPPWPDPDSGPHTDACAVYELRQHRLCGLTNSNDIDGGRTRQDLRDCCVAKRDSDERRRISRTHGRAQYFL